MAEGKTRVTLTVDQLEHLFWTMDGICAAGSENEKDEELAHLLAQAMSRRGLQYAGVVSWLISNSRHIRSRDLYFNCSNCGPTPYSKL